MKKTIALSFFCVLAFCLTALANELTAIITIDGVEHKININEDKKIIIGAKEHTVNIKLDKYREFKIEGISFKYNSNMSYAEDTSDPNVAMWSLNGDTNVIMVQKYEVAITNKRLSDLMKEQFESMKATVSIEESILKYKDSQLKGFKLKIKFGDVFLSQEIYSKVINGKTIAIIIQDTLSDGKTSSSEYKDSMKLIQDTLVFKE